MLIVRNCVTYNHVIYNSNWVMSLTGGWKILPQFFFFFFFFYFSFFLIFLHTHLHKRTIDKHNIKCDVPVNHVWVLPEIRKRAKNIGNFSHTIDCSSCDFFFFLKKQSLGKGKCDTLGTKGQLGRFVIVLLMNRRSACGSLAAQARY